MTDESKIIDDIKMMGHTFQVIEEKTNSKFILMENILIVFICWLLLLMPIAKIQHGLF